MEKLLKSQTQRLSFVVDQNNDAFSKYIGK